MVGERMMRCILDIGEEMLRSGAEVRRVEDSMERMFAACGVVRSDVLAIASGIHATVLTAEGLTLTQTRRVRTCVTDYGKVDALNGLSRYICSTHPDEADIRARLAAIAAGRRESPLWALLGGVLGSGAFAVFFGGSALDGLAAALLSLPYSLFGRYLRKGELNPVIYNFLWSLLFGLASQGLARTGLGISADMVAIGCIMLMTPGVLVTGSLRDMLLGDTITGALRLSEALLMTAAIAAGFAAAILIFAGGGAL